MTKSEAITIRDNWKTTKSDYETKIERLNTAKTCYFNNLETGNWSTLLFEFYAFKSKVNPDFKSVDWEGKRVVNYLERLESLEVSLKQEGSKHYDVISQFEEQMQRYETKVEDAQEHIDYWQRVIDNWCEEE